MSIWDILFLTWLFKDKDNKEKSSKPSIIFLIIGLLGYYLIILLFIYLICMFLKINIYPIIYWIYTSIFILFSLILIISEIISKLEKHKKRR